MNGDLTRYGETIIIMWLFKESQTIDSAVTQENDGSFGVKGDIIWRAMRGLRFR